MFRPITTTRCDASGKNCGFKQSAFAKRIGAAGKAVVYQWETRKRRPSPVFWKKITALTTTSCGPVK
jgi:DNA-binding transcriptional regulator YiaG